MEKCYSIDREGFNFMELGELFDAMESDGRLIAGAVYYEGDSIPIDLSDMFPVWRILEEAEERLFDEIGEAAEGAFLFGEEAEKEFAEFLSGWIKRHSKGSYWSVNNIIEKVVTHEDIASQYGSVDQP